MSTILRNCDWIYAATCGAALALLAGCNATPGPATVAAKPAAAKSSPMAPQAIAAQPTKLETTAVVSKETAAPKRAIEIAIGERPNPAKVAEAKSAEAKPAAQEPELVALVVAPPAPPKKEPKWKPTIAPQPPRPTFAPPATKFEFVPGPVGELLKGQIGEGAPAQLAAPRGKPAPQRDGPSPAVQAAEKSTYPLPVSAYAYQGELKPLDRSKLPPTHPARDLPQLALNREPAVPSGAVMPIGALAIGEIPPVPAVQMAAKKVEGKPAPPADPTREPAFAATIRIAGTDVIGAAPFEKISLPNPFERSDEVRLRSEPLDTEGPGLLPSRIVERPVMPVPMPMPAVPPK